MEKTVTSAKMGDMPIGKLLFRMSAPAIISMMVQALYNITDSIFVSRVGEDALTALSIAYPMQMFVLAFALGLSIGTSSLVSRRLGQKNPLAASITAKNGLFIVLCVSVFWAVFGWAAAQIFSGMFAEKGTVIYEYAYEYLLICVTCAAGFSVEIYFTRLMQSMGSMIVPMIAQLIGAVTNIALDPLFIFGVGKWEGMGVKGAAVATVIGQLCAMVFAISMFFRKKNELDFSFKRFRPDKRVIWDIVKIGLPVMVLNALPSIATTAMNAILIAFSSTAVAILGVYFKLQSFVFMPVFGLNQGSMPIMAYNYGANNKKRFMKTMRLCYITGCAFMVMGLCLFHGIPDKLLLLFDASADMLDMGVHALRVISLSFITAAFSIVTINMFQSLGKGFISMLMSILRQIGFLLPIALIFSKTAGLYYVWWTYPISEVLTIAVFAPIAVFTVRKCFAALNPLPVPEMTEPVGDNPSATFDEVSQEDALSNESADKHDIA